MRGQKRSLSGEYAVPARRYRKPVTRPVYKSKSFSGASKFTNNAGKTPEIKFIDNTLNVNTTNNGGVFLMNGSVQGTDSTNRIGRKIQMTSCQVDLKYANSAANLGVAASWPTGTGHAKWAVVYDKQTNAGLPVYTDIFDSSGSIVAPFAHRNISYLDRFDVLASGTCDISVSGPQTESVSKYVKMRLDTRYTSGNSGGIGDIDSGALYFVYVDDNANNANAATMYGRLRVRFQDI